MKKLLTLVSAMIIAATAFCQQVTEATITVIGTGVDEEQATLQGLRSAIEQTFGTFVSANTTILNDQLVQDEIVSVSNGNVKQYKKLAVATLPNKHVSVTLTATISINKLVNYAQSKGSRAEFAGDAFATNRRLMELRAKSTEKALELLAQQLDKIADDMFDLKLQLGTPQKSGDSYFFLPEIEVYSNEASTIFVNLLVNTLKALALSEEDREFCRNSGIAIRDWRLPYGGIEFWGDYHGNIMDDDYWKKIGMPFVLPLSSKICSELHVKIWEALAKAYFGYSIREIGNTTNLYEMRKRGNCSIQQQLLKGSNQEWLEYDLYSNREGKCYKINYVPVRSAGLYKIGPSWSLTEVRTPIQLTSRQKREVQNGTYTGPTYTIEYKDPQLLLKLVTSISVPAERMESGRFQGFELVPTNKVEASNAANVEENRFNENTTPATNSPQVESKDIVFKKWKDLPSDVKSIKKIRVITENLPQKELQVKFEDNKKGYSYACTLSVSSSEIKLTKIFNSSTGGEPATSVVAGKEYEGYVEFSIYSRDCTLIDLPKELEDVILCGPFYE